MINSQATSVTSLTLHLSAIVACSIFWLANDQDSHTFRNADASMPKRCYRTILIVLTVACGLGALVTAPTVLLTAAMGFDAPGSEYQVWAWIVFILVLSTPFWFVIGAIVFGPRPLRR